MSVEIIVVGLALALFGAFTSARCKHRRSTGKLPEDIQ